MHGPNIIKAFLAVVILSLLCHVTAPVAAAQNISDSTVTVTPKAEDLFTMSSDPEQDSFDAGMMMLVREGELLLYSNGREIRKSEVPEEFWKKYSRASWWKRHSSSVCIYSGGFALGGLLEDETLLLAGAAVCVTLLALPVDIAATERLNYLAKEYNHGKWRN